MRVNGEKNFPKTYKIWQYIVLTNCEKRGILLLVYTVDHYLIANDKTFGVCYLPIRREQIFDLCICEAL